jgi:hypothetical protein
MAAGESVILKEQSEREFSAATQVHVVECGESLLSRGPERVEVDGVPVFDETWRES